jgi:hypothetical protein
MNGLPQWHLDGPDDNDHVWIHIGKESWNLGPKDAAVERLCEWLGSIDADEAEMRRD